MTNEQPFKTKVVRVPVPDGVNLIFGQSHFIKTVEDLYEALVTASMGLKFGVAFCESSGKRLIRSDGNDQEMIELAERAAFDVGCGHSFFVYVKGGFPINVLNRVKEVQEVCRIYCATANQLQVIVAETEQGRGVLAVIDGEPPLGIETDEDKKERTAFLRKIGYKR
ncbi:MAG: adenosine-specific kinase [Candidatus Zixiibacteriota bacterium]